MVLSTLGFHRKILEVFSMNTKLTGACIIGQSGGPTAVINASAYGAIRAALDCPVITGVYGADHGITGVINDILYDLSAEDSYELSLLMNTPSSELGSCRYKMADPDKDDTDYRKILDTFRKHNVRYFFYIGGNDSMDTCDKISRYMEKVGYDCRVMGIPKTIDNDLYGTDHCPGFGSAAKYIATACMEVSKDARVYDTGMITVIEIMGRHAGWLAGSAALATRFGSGPDLIYLPETDFDLEGFYARVEDMYRTRRKVLVAVSEGIHDKDGRFIADVLSASAGTQDAFGHTQLGGVALALANELKKRTGAKVRGIELSLLQRCAAHCASKADVDEACMAGAAAVTEAAAGVTGMMVAFRRAYEDGRYVCRTELQPLTKVANYENKVPVDWITPDGANVTEDFIDYVLPLIQGEPVRVYEHSLPRYARLKKVRVQ